MAHFSRLIVNTATALTLAGRHWAWTQSFLHAAMWLRKSECSKSFESERFTILVAQVENCGEKFDDCANKWEWVSVNGSPALVKSVGDVKSQWDARNSICLYLRFVSRQDVLHSSFTHTHRMIACLQMGELDLAAPESVPSFWWTRSNTLHTYTTTV